MVRHSIVTADVINVVSLIVVSLRALRLSLAVCWHITFNRPGQLQHSILFHFGRQNTVVLLWHWAQIAMASNFAVLKTRLIMITFILYFVKSNLILLMYLPRRYYVRFNLSRFHCSYSYCVFCLLCIPVLWILTISVPLLTEWKSIAFLFKYVSTCLYTWQFLSRSPNVYLCLSI